MIQDREERYSRIRTDFLLLPLEQKPSPHQIFGAMLRQERAILLRLSNISDGWSLSPDPITFTSTAGVKDYTVSLPAQRLYGKSVFAVKQTGDLQIPEIKVRVNEFTTQEVGNAADAPFSEESIAVYRTDVNNASIRLRLNPTPQQSATYQIWFDFVGMDGQQMDWDETFTLPEIADYLDLLAAKSLLPACEWKLNNDEFNMARRKEIRENLIEEIAMLKPVVDDYIDNINAPQVVNIGYWNR